MKKDIRKVFFTEMRGVIVDDSKPLTNEGLQKAVTLNENLAIYGVCFNARDLIRVAKSDMDAIYEEIKAFTPSVKAKPMYPDFPTQVMEMDEATFRYHQLVHYFSTYGMEFLFGVEVDKGWLPKVEETEKTKEDIVLFPAKVLQVYTEKEADEAIARRIIEKTERWTIPEKKLATYVLTQTDAPIHGIPFKENMGDICYSLLCDEDVETAFAALKKVCQHAGDVFRMIHLYQCRRHYRPMTTSRKRHFVRLLESYGEDNLRENLYPSNVQFQKEMKGILNSLSFNKFGKDWSKALVAQARNGELRSWKGKVEALLEKMDCGEVDADDVAKFIAKRPGEYYRMLVRLYRLKMPKDVLIANALEHADKYRLQMLLTTLNSLSAKYAKEKVNLDEDGKESLLSELHFMREVSLAIISKQLATKETPLKGKRVFLDETVYDFDNSIIETNDKSMEGGYIRSGVAFHIPEKIKKLRFFVYWNDKERIDIDLHSFIIKTNGDKEHIGWNGSYKESYAVTSGDITHSDAAEYIDIDMEKAKKADVAFIYNHIKSFTRVPFKSIETCFVGMMGVSKIAAGDKKMKLHDVKNEFFHHELESKETSLNYAYINVPKRYLRIMAKPSKGVYEACNNAMSEEAILSLREYIAILFETQEVTLVDTKEEADIIVALDKPQEENGISLLDENYFLEA